METTFNVDVTRTFNAPVADVWRAWSEAEHLKKWWGPAGFTSPMAELDFREGGQLLISMKAPAEYGGAEMFSQWNYTSIVPQERIAYTFNFTDAKGNKIEPSQAGVPEGVPADGHHEVTFKALPDGRTEMHMIEYGYTTEDAKAISQAGLEQCLDKMAAIFS